MDLNTLIDRIGFFRNKANLSARQLSLQIGKNAGYIHLLETNRKFAPTFDTLVDILETCNTTFEEFFYRNPQSYKQDMMILDLLETASEDKKKAIIALLKQ